MDLTNQFGPLLGFTLTIWFALWAVWLFVLLAVLSVPFSLWAMRRLLDQQLATLKRMEGRLAAAEIALGGRAIAPAETTTAAGAAPAASSGYPPA